MKPKRRKKQSGVVMVEAIIAISMIIVMFGGVAYFHNAYVAKARVLREARMQAWRATFEENPEVDIIEGSMLSMSKLT